jgi:translation initiation factor IF-2
LAKKRVHEAAKDFNISSDALLKVLRDLGFQHKGYMSYVSEKEIRSVRDHFEREKAALKEGYDRKKVKKETSRVVVKRSRRGRRKGFFHKPKLDEKKIEEKVKRTLTRIEHHPEKKKRRERPTRVEEEAPTAAKITISEFSTVQELAQAMDLPPAAIIKKCMELGALVTINQRLDMDTITMIADEFGLQVEFPAEIDVAEQEEGEVEEISRSPVVTVMGHVDHGKTALLDYIRKTNVIAGEAGGITQHIGAYVVTHEDKNITFLDTPGHKAFTAMRSRGVQITDIVVLIIAVNDGVMPQTDEAIDHSRAAGVPIVIAINKMDLPNANSEKVKKQLSERGIVVEDWGGKALCCEISAKTGAGVDDLLNAILLEAEMLELKAPVDVAARGVIIEAKLDKSKGVSATLLIQKGVLHVGESFVAGIHFGRVRAMFDEWGHQLKECGPSRPALILGFDGLPQVGDNLLVTKDEREAREISQKRKLLKEEQRQRLIKKISLKDFQEQLKEGETKELNVILKGDVGGSLEALSDSVESLSGEKVRLTVIHKGVGPVNESDVLLASASNGLIAGLHVPVDKSAEQAAKREGVEIRLYNVIYQAVDDIKKAMAGLLEPEYEEEVVGTAEVKQLFRIPRIGVVAGCYVREGTVVSKGNVRVLREGEAIHEGKIASLRRFKEDVKEVKSGLECGIGIDGFSAVEEGDVLEVYVLREVKTELE